jgi:hypothetical protein
VAAGNIDAVANRQRYPILACDGREHKKTPPKRGFLAERLMGFEPTTFCMASGTRSFGGLRLSDVFPLGHDFRQSRYSGVCG